MSSIELLGGPYDGAHIDVPLPGEGPWTDVQLTQTNRIVPLDVFCENAFWYRIWHHDPTRAHYQSLGKDTR